jgi:hypothetical protein
VHALRERPLTRGLHEVVLLAVLDVERQKPAVGSPDAKLEKRFSFT